MGTADVPRNLGNCDGNHTVNQFRQEGTDETEKSAGRFPSSRLLLPTFHGGEGDNSLVVVFPWFFRLVFPSATSKNAVASRLSALSPHAK